MEVSTLKSLKLIPGGSNKDASDVFLQGPTGSEVTSPEARGYEF